MPSEASNKRRGAQTTENSAKRTRVSRACDQCRLAREKCDGNQPACSTCSAAKRACTYAASVKKRGIQPGYIRALELALAILFQHKPENENLANDKLAEGGTSSVLLSRDSKESNKLHKQWRKTRFFADVDKLLSGGEPSRYEPPSPDSDDDDEPDAINTSVILSSDLFSSTPHSANLPKRPEGIEARHASLTLHRYIMPDESWRLLEIYFNYTHCWMPICEKHDILKLSYSYPAEGLDLIPTAPDYGAHAELWSVLALASLYPEGQMVALRFKQLYKAAQSLIPDELGSFQIGHVKALLNLAIMNIATGSNNAARILVCLAARIISISDELSPIQNPKNKAVYYGCFVLDSILMQHRRLGNPPMSSLTEYLGPIDEDGLDEWQPWTSGQTAKPVPRTPLLALSTFNALIKLTEILSNLKQRPHEGLQSLEMWKTQLPDRLDHVCAQQGSSHPLTPPAILLHVTAACVHLAVSPSREVLFTTIEVLHRALSHVGPSCLPPILRCLLDSLEEASSALDVDQGMRDRLISIRDNLEGAFPKADARSHAKANKASTLGQTPSSTGMQIPTPRSAVDQSIPNDANPSLITPFHQSLTHQYAGTIPARFDSSMRDNTATAQLNPGLTDMTTELDSFFDELASLDNPRPMDDQPRFMQNLGFAPDANMADLFSEYIPLQSSTFLLQDDQLPTNIDQFGFYDGM